jgi:hypothetical protein
MNKSTTWYQSYFSAFEDLLLGTISDNGRRLWASGNTIQMQLASSTPRYTEYGDQLEDYRRNFTAATERRILCQRR